jgi:hypothetical protein
MNKRFLFVVVLALAFALPAAAGGGTQRDLLYLQNGSGVRVSIETYRAKEGWTPVIVSVAGAEVSAAMDAKGRVFRNGADARDGRGLPLFTIELEKGRILIGRESHATNVYEQNAVRTRLRLVEGAILLPLQLDARGAGGTLRFGGLGIPATVNQTAPVRTVGNRLNRPAAAATQVAPPKGHKAFAQLTPSRIRARGK